MRASFLSFSLPASRLPSSNFWPGGERWPVPRVFPQASASSVASSSCCATLIASACRRRVAFASICFRSSLSCAALRRSKASAPWTSPPTRSFAFCKAFLPSSDRSSSEIVSAFSNSCSFSLTISSCFWMSQRSRISRRVRNFSSRTDASIRSPKSKVDSPARASFNSVCSRRNSYWPPCRTAWRNFSLSRALGRTSASLKNITLYLKRRQKMS